MNHFELFAGQVKAKILKEIVEGNQHRLRRKKGAQLEISGTIEQALCTDAGRTGRRQCLMGYIIGCHKTTY